MYIPFKAGKGAVDETGKIYGQLTVLGIVSKNRYGSVWECMCSCGTLTQVRGIHLRRENGTRSCGCVRGKETKHGLHNTPTYLSWKSMKARCNDPNATGAQNWHGRGITYDPAWESFEAFYADMGERPAGTTLDRKDNDLNYNKGNCRWATPKEQANNRRARGK